MTRMDIRNREAKWRPKKELSYLSVSHVGAFAHDHVVCIDHLRN